MKKLKLFAVSNGNSESDFALNEDMVCGGSNAHSGGAIVVAKNIKEAEKMILKQIKEDDSYDSENGVVGVLKEIKLNKKGVVLFADGDC